MESEFNMGENKHEDTMVMAEQQYSQSGLYVYNIYIIYIYMLVLHSLSSFKKFNDSI